MDSIKGPASKTSEKLYTVTVNPTGPQINGISLGLGVAVEVVDTGTVTAEYKLKNVNGNYSSETDNQLLMTDNLIARAGDVITITSGPDTGRQIIVLDNDGAGGLTVSEELIESKTNTAIGTTFDVERPRYIRISDLGGGGGTPVPSIDSIIQVTDGNVGTALEILKTGTPTQGELKTMVFNPANIAASDTGNDLLIALASTITSSHTFSTTQTFNGTVNSNGLQLNNVHVGGTLSFAAGFGTTLSAGSTRLNVTSGTGNVELMNQTGSSPNSSTGSRVTVMNNGGGTMTFVHGVATSGTNFGFRLPGGNNLVLENNEGAIFERSREAGETTWKLVGLGQIPSTGGSSKVYQEIATYGPGGTNLLSAGAISWTVPASFTNDLDLYLVPDQQASFSGPSTLSIQDSAGTGLGAHTIEFNSSVINGAPVIVDEREMIVIDNVARNIGSLLILSVKNTLAGATVTLNVAASGSGGAVITATNYKLVAIER